MHAGMNGKTTVSRSNAAFGERSVCICGAILQSTHALSASTCFYRRVLRIGQAVPAEAHIPGVEEHRITINGIEWRYLRAGSGPALLLVHGLMGFSWSWRFNMCELAKSFTVYAPDLPGCGFSQRDDQLADHWRAMPTA